MPAEENLRRKASGRVDGFVVEAAIAGGHNAPPRGPMQLTPAGEPIYGERDRIDPAKFADIGLPFWLAGGYGRIGKLREAQALGARGIQVGTAFAFCEESGFEPELKARILASVKAGEMKIHTDAFASPTGFPFKVARMPGSIADPAVYEERERICDLGYLRLAVAAPDGRIAYRCPSEPVDAFGIWCSTSYLPKEQQVWEGMPDVVKDNGFLFLTKVDLLGSREAADGMLERVEARAGEEFRQVLAISAKQARAAMPPGEPVNRDLFRDSGAAAVITTIKSRVQAARRADTDMAELLLARHVEAGGIVARRFAEPCCRNR